MNRFCRRWLAAGGAVLLGLPGVRAQETAPADPLPARPGGPLTVELGRGQRLDFVWLAPLNMWVGQDEVSNGAYRRYDAAHSSSNVLGREMDEDFQPAVRVSWDDADNYCGWLNRRHGRNLPPGYLFRLPSETEWEAYARCGTARRYPWGDQWPPPDDHNYRGMEGSGFWYAIFQREKFIRGRRDGYVVSAPVERSGRNEWGLCGVGGNVWEWCRDWFDAARHKRVIRGGAWNNEREETLRVAHRAGVPPDWRNDCIGFRVVAGPPLP